MPVEHWYTNPTWYAVAVSLLALIVSLFTYFHNRASSRLSLQTNLINKAIEINSSFVQYKVKGPYAFHLNIPDANVQNFTSKGILLLQQINLLREVYEHRDILGKKTVETYVTWTTTILRPWIESDSDLKASWKLVKDTKDVFGEDFIKWVAPHIPII
jgi:hypothetical protein